ncbi:tetratricopeptide repeat-containing sulfotransferase family protein [uncultured Nevskia sp.]|uniref:tetratricopeptide repeat-containing sulfotransferase family protein n=1 Tax=uncultured Nevskia sp. TaxID=228950 RepID=UPI0025CC0C34|nr:tetratricopeptide repeat-containing sulfotransferase family protein [uncultured Nevskia sp.]
MNDVAETTLDAEAPLGETLQSLLNRGDSVGALALCRARIAQAPDGPDAHRHLGQMLAASGAFDAAHRHARRACELAPDDPRSWSDLGRVHALEGKFDDAAQCFAEAIRIDDRHADAWHNLGTALKKRGDRDGAFKALKTALLIDPSRADTYLNLGNLLIDAGQLEDALECFERAARHDPALARARSRLAQYFSQAGKVKQAESLFRQALGLDPDHLQGWFGLGRTLEDLGEAEGALGCYLQVLNRRPQHAQALGQYLALVRDEPEAGVLSMARTLLENPAVKDEARALIGYGLVKFHDRRQDYAQAAAAGLAGNAARRQANGPLDRAALSQRIDRIIETFDGAFFESRRRLGLGTDQPVFIVGLPRSGTTLTEQILASHPLLHGAGELPDLSRLANGVIGNDEEPWQAAQKLDEMSSRTLALDYLKALREDALKSASRISDKSPLNFFQLAFAALLFPNARVVHCIRDGRDNALSIWMENFSPDQRYATDFDDLAFFRQQYLRLMAHWRQVLPLKILELRYEDTVADLEGQARRLIGFLDAPWDARCLAFHKAERAVQTPSRWQVRQPIYTKSVARWKAYAEHLPALDRAFRDDQAGEPC